MVHAPTPATQRDIPARRTGTTTAVRVGGESLRLTASARADGALGEVLLSWGKHGHTQAGLADSYAIALTVGLQHGIPAGELVRQGLDTYFVPNGHTDDPQLPRVSSLADYIARRLACDWLSYTERAQLGVYTVDERVSAAADWLAAEDAKIPDLVAVPSPRCEGIVAGDRAQSAPGADVRPALR